MLSSGVGIFGPIFAGGDPVQCPSCHHRWRELLLRVLHAGDHHSLHGLSAEAQCLQGLLAAWVEGGTPDVFQVTLCSVRVAGSLEDRKTDCRVLQRGSKMIKVGRRMCR